MKQKQTILLLLATLLLGGCTNNPKSEDSSLPVESSSTSQPVTSESSALSSSEETPISSEEVSSSSEEVPSSSEEVTSSSEEIPSSSEEISSSSEEVSSSSEEVSASSEESSSSEVLPPLNDPDVQGLVRSEVWPSAALYEFLSYTEMFVMPELTSETSFHHGLYNDELFYRVLTRVRSNAEFDKYQIILESENDFIFSVDEYGYTRGETYYGEVQLILSIKPFANFFEIAFDFFDGDEYQPKGLVAVDNVAFFNFDNREAIVKKSTEQVKWEVAPVTFKVSQGSAGYSVGGSNYDKISRPLTIYAGNILNFSVDNPAYYIAEIKVLAASGYADRFVDQGEFDNSNLEIDVAVDWVTIVPKQKISNLTYQRFNVTNVGQIRFVNLKVTIAKY